MKKLFITSIGINIGLSAIIIILSLALTPDEIFKSGDNCDYGKEFLKIKDEFGLRYFDLPLDQRTAFDNEFNQISSDQTQEAFDLEYEKLLEKYGIIESMYNEEEKQELFYRFIRICQDK